MRIKYDFHVHSALSSCADDDMTPRTVVGVAALVGLQAVAIADHNAIGNVEAAIAAGKKYGVCVVPAMELQTAEDIHVLCLFPSPERLRAFYEEIVLPALPLRKNDTELFGSQWLYNEEDEVLGEDDRFLHIGVAVGAEKVPQLVKTYGGVAVAAHVDRPSNGMVAILGDITPEYDVVELSSTADEQEEALYRGRNKTVLRDSDAHWTDEIGAARGCMEVEELTAEAIVEALRK